MTRKDYEKVAEILLRQKKRTDYGNDRCPIAEIAAELVAMFQADNPRFNADLFLRKSGF